VRSWEQFQNRKLLTTKGFRPHSVLKIEVGDGKQLKYFFHFRVLGVDLFDSQLMTLHHAQALEKNSNNKAYELSANMKFFQSKARECSIVDNIDAFAI